MDEHVTQDEQALHVTEDEVIQDEHTYKFDVKMSCSGCSGAIERVLGKTEGVTSFDVSLEKQEVIVTGPATYDTVLEKIKKTGKEVRSGVTIQ